MRERRGESADDDERPRPRRRKRRSREDNRMPPSVKLAIVGAIVLALGFATFMIVRRVTKKDPPTPVNETVQTPTNSQPVRQPAPKQPQVVPKKWPDFVADPEAIKQLGDETVFAGRRLRIPPGWVVHPTPPLSRGQAMIWKDANAKRDDNSAPNVQLVVLDLTQEEMNQISWKPEDVLNSSVNTEVRGLVDVKKEPTEKGYINGVYGLRGKWSGRNPQSKRLAHGVVYVFFDNLQLVVMHTGLTEPGHEEAIKLGDAAMLSIKRQGP